MNRLELTNPLSITSNGIPLRPLNIDGRSLLLAWILSLGIACRVQSANPAWPSFLLTQTGAAAEWTAPHDGTVQSTTEGLQLDITGPDPYVHGPERDYPAGQPGWLEVTLQASQPGTGQIFWYQDGARETDSIRFSVGTTNWWTARLPIPPLGKAYRLRLDPPGETGSCIVRSIVSSQRLLFQEPNWKRPDDLTVSNQPLAQVVSGTLGWQQVGTHWGEFVIHRTNETIAQGNPHSLVGWIRDGTANWTEITNPVALSFSNSTVTLQTSVPFGTESGVILEQIVSIGPEAETLSVVTRMTALADCEILMVPLLILHPKSTVFGSEPHQGLFAGVEYLEAEASSSERALRGLQALRKVPHADKITFPLMAVASTNEWLSLDWKVDPKVAALLDVPDRIWHSDGPVIGLLAPGSHEPDRPDGAILPYTPLKMSAGEVLTARAVVGAGTGNTVVPAIEGWMRRNPPRAPEELAGRQAVTQFLGLAAHGWLDSRLRNGNRFRHAVGSNFGAQPASDAALWMDWLSTQVQEPGLAERLKAASASALAEVPTNLWSTAQIGHVRYPLLPLVFGHVAENLATLEAAGIQKYAEIRPKALQFYTPNPGHPDLSETHGSREANGLVSFTVRQVLEAALITGNRQLRAGGLILVNQLSRWKNTVPRGAQSWEVPLHAPDILAAAQLVDVYRMAYQFSRDPGYMLQARYWAWTGLPFVYMPDIPQDRVGLYATTPVFGATEYVAPNWIGLPVQWCGMVYANALQNLSLHDHHNSWSTLARGITWSGVLQSHPSGDEGLVGLLPDSFNLGAQVRNPVPINPATVLSGVPDYLGLPPLFTSKWIPEEGVGIHAPGAIEPWVTGNETVDFKVNAWPDHPWWLLISGLHRRPEIRVNGMAYSESDGDEWVPAKGWAALKIKEHTASFAIHW